MKQSLRAFLGVFFFFVSLNSYATYIYPPSSVNCASGNYNWTNNVTVSGTTVNADVRFIDGQTTKFKLPNLPTSFNQAVTISVSEVVSWDGYSTRNNVNQAYEQWKVVFIKGGTVVYQTEYTKDVGDYQYSAEWKGSLGTSQTFINGVDEIYLVHIEDPTYGSGTGSYSSANSVVPAAVCLTYQSLSNPVCTRKVANTRGCSSTPYIIWLRDKYNVDHELNGDTTKYEWLRYANGDVRVKAKGLTASGLAGTYDVDFYYTGHTTTTPSGSPKNSTCFTTPSTSNWEYWTGLTGVITSSAYGTIAITRMGPAMQMGNGANPIENGFGASSWLTLNGGGGQFTAGDINLMLSASCTEEEPVCTKKVSNTRGCGSSPYVLWLKDKNNVAYHLKGDSTKYEWLEYANGDMRLKATGLTANGLSGTYSMDLRYTGFTTTAPANSPKTSTCFTSGSTSEWVYWTGLTGTITSSTYGTIAVTRMGPSMQMGEDANITQAGYGASG